MVIAIEMSSAKWYLYEMPPKTNARARAIDTAERLFRIQGYSATGLTQIIRESGSPKGSFYFHFPRGKTQLAEETIDQYVAKRVDILQRISASTTGNAQNFVNQVLHVLAAEMVASDFQYGCLMQNLANELASLDAELTSRVARGFVHCTEIVAAHLRGCGFDPARASSRAAALEAAAEGARTIARLERTPAIYKALEEVSTQLWHSDVGPAASLSTVMNSTSKPAGSCLSLK